MERVPLRETYLDINYNQLTTRSVTDMMMLYK